MKAEQKEIQIREQLRQVTGECLDRGLTESATWYFFIFF